MALPRLSVLALLLALSGGCVLHTGVRTTVVARPPVAAYAAPNYVHVTQPPPPLQADTAMGGKPDPNAQWVAGYWRWEGQWVWQAGHWEVPRAGHVWEPPVCVSVASGGYQYHRGYWRPQQDAPPTVYRTPGTIRVNARTPGRAPRTERVEVQAGVQVRGRVVVSTSQAQGRSETVRTTTVVRQNQGSTTVVTPSQPGTVVVTPGNPPSQPTNTVVVNPRTQSSATTNTVVVNPRTQSSATTNTVVVNPRTQSSATANTVVVNPRTQSSATANTVVVNPRTQATAVVDTTLPQPQCRVGVTRVPRNSFVVLQGSNLQGVSEVRIGGQLASIAERSATSIRARVGSRGGSVRVVSGGQSYSCGSVSVM